MKVSNWKDLSGFIFDRATGVNKDVISDDEWAQLDKDAVGIMGEVGNDEIQAKAKKIMNLNILDKNVDFKFFQKIPNVWALYYTNCIALAAVSAGQVI